MKKITDNIFKWIAIGFLACLGYLAIAYSVEATYIQPIYSSELNVISYINRLYYKYDYATGIAGYKSLDKIARLEKISFVDDSNNRIHMIRTLPNKDIVGYGIKVWESEFSLEDSDCDGVMDIVGIYNKSVFPPNCFYKEAI